MHITLKATGADAGMISHLLAKNPIIKMSYGNKGGS